jgi:antitoxin VapB
MRGNDRYHVVKTTRGGLHERDSKGVQARRRQAVRLPKEFRFEGSEVRVTTVGDRVILEQLESSAAMPWAIIDAAGDSPFMPRGRDQPAMPKDRVVFER